VPELLDHGRERHADQSLVLDEEYGSQPRHAGIVFKEDCRA
jgi:hypothetical protein